MGAESEIETLARRVQAENRLPSLVVAGARDGQVLDAALLGEPDVDAPRGRGVVDPLQMAYRIGSVTKTFTAAVVLLLAERGRLDLDAAVGTYLRHTEFGSVPVRSLLAHCGGLPREVPVDMWKSMQGPGPAELRAAFADVRVVDRPWRRWHYSNLGYAVLGQVVADVTGTPCEDVITTEVLQPLGLSATSWTQPAEAAVGYRLDPYADRVHREPVMDQGAVGVGGQLWSTAGDLLRWGDALAGGAPEVLPLSVVEAMHTLHVMADPQSWTTAWGLGLILTRRGERVMAGHTGAMPGFLAALQLDRETRSVAVVLTNVTRGVAAGDVAGHVLDHVVTTATTTVAAPWSPGQPCPPELEAVLGRWWSEADETVISWRGGTLHAHLASDPEHTGTRFVTTDDPDVWGAAEGRWTGEELSIRRTHRGEVVGLEWATYPLTREPR